MISIVIQTLSFEYRTSNACLSQLRDSVSVLVYCGSLFQVGAGSPEPGLLLTDYCYAYNDGALGEGKKRNNADKEGDKGSASGSSN